MIGLDLGSTWFRCISRCGHRLIARRAPTGYVILDAGPPQDRLLSQARIPLRRADNACIVLGGDAEHVAAAMSRPVVPLFPEGELPRADPVGRQVAADLLEAVLGAESADGSACTLVLPRDQAAGEATHDFFVRLLQLRGLRPHVIAAAHAVGLAELGREQFSGFTLCLGASSSSLALIERGVVRSHAALPRGGAWMDRELAHALPRRLFDASGNRYLDMAHVTEWKQVVDLADDDRESPQTAWLQQAYSELLTALFEKFRSSLVREGLEARRSLPLIVHGGVARIAGFDRFLDRMWRASLRSVPLRDIRLAGDPEYCVARGCLIHAELMAATGSASAA